MVILNGLRRERARRLSGEDVIRAQNHVVFAATVTSVPPYLPYRRLRRLDVDGRELAAIEPLAGADGEHGSALGLFLAESAG